MFYGLYSLILNQEEKIKKEKIRLSIKQITIYYTAKIGILLGPNLKHGNPEWYE